MRKLPIAVRMSGTPFPVPRKSRPDFGPPAGDTEQVSVTGKELPIVGTGKSDSDNSGDKSGNKGDGNSSGNVGDEDNVVILGAEARVNTGIGKPDQLKYSLRSQGGAAPVQLGVFDRVESVTKAWESSGSQSFTTRQGVPEGAILSRGPGGSRPRESIEPTRIPPQFSLESPITTGGADKQQERPYERVTNVPINRSEVGEPGEEESFQVTPSQCSTSLRGAGRYGHEPQVRDTPENQFISTSGDLTLPRRKLSFEIATEDRQSVLSGESEEEQNYLSSGKERRNNTVKSQETGAA